MKKVYLHGKYGKGKFALISDVDFERVSKYKWYYSKSTGYATTTVHISGCPQKGNRIQETQRLHRFIMRLKKGDNQQVDHRSRNRLDCQRSNLRLATHSQNRWNSKLGKGTNIEYKGVMYDKRERKYIANCQSKYLGSFSDPKTAALAYDKAARVFYGEFACLNFVDEFLSEDIKLPHVDRPPKDITRKAKYLGVSYFGHGGKRVKRWRATYKRKNLGYFHTEIEAAKAYAEARGISLEDCRN